MHRHRDDARRPERHERSGQHELRRPTASERDATERARSPWPDEPVLHDA